MRYESPASPLTQDHTIWGLAVCTFSFLISSARDGWGLCAGVRTPIGTPQISGSKVPEPGTASPADPRHTVVLTPVIISVQAEDRGGAGGPRDDAKTWLEDQVENPGYRILEK